MLGSGTTERGNGSCGVGTQGIACIKIPDNRSVQGHPKPGDAVRWRDDSRGEGEKQFREQCFVAKSTVVSIDDGGEAASGHDLNIGRSRPTQPALPRVVDNRVSQRVV